MSVKCWICGTDYENAWHVCPACGPAEPWGPVAEDYRRVFDDDKRETELSDPRYIEDFLEDES